MLEYWLTKEAMEGIKEQLRDSIIPDPYVRIGFNSLGKKAEISTEIVEWSNTLGHTSKNKTTSVIPEWIDKDTLFYDEEEKCVEDFQMVWMPINAFMVCCELIKGNKWIKIGSQYNELASCVEYHITDIKKNKKNIVMVKFNDVVKGGEKTYD